VFTSDGETLVAAGNTGVDFWEPLTGPRSAPTPENTESTTTVAASPDGGMEALLGVRLDEHGAVVSLAEAECQRGSARLAAVERPQSE
jgi:hypothetical protein